MHYTSLLSGFLLGGAVLVQTQTPAVQPDPPDAGQTQAATSASAPSGTSTSAPSAPAPAAPAAPATPTPPPPGPLHQWGTDFTFLFDGYTDANFNNPASGFNGLRNFDVRSDTLHLNMAEITIDHAPGPVGFHLDVGFGEMFDIIHSGNRDPNAWKYFKQGYIDFKPKSWHGVEIDVGEFVTSAGAEVIETNQNFNYSRSLLFAWAIPYSHTGVRAQYALGSHFTGSVQVVNGWNNVEPINSGKTYGFTGAYAWKKVTWNNNYYVGPEHPKTTTGWRNLYDTSVVVNPNDNLSYYDNFDYAHDKNVGPGASAWVGLAGAVRQALGKKFAVAGRLEFFDDRNGLSTGVAQTVKEFTLTGEYKITDWLMTRGEFRNDWSDKPFFENSDGQMTAKNQPTLLLGMIAYFAPKK
jgi:hypothetical protein